LLAIFQELHQVQGFIDFDRGKFGLDSSLKNVKQNDFKNEVAGSGCGEVKQNNFKIDDILDGFVSAIIGGLFGRSSTMKSLGQAAASKSTIFCMALSAR
jgi:hypothetical protein